MSIQQVAMMHFNWTIACQWDVTATYCERFYPQLLQSDNNAGLMLWYASMALQSGPGLLHMAFHTHRHQIRSAQCLRDG